MAKGSHNGLPSDNALNSKLEKDRFPRQATVDEYAQTFNQGFYAPAPLDRAGHDVVLITGGTGSLGLHLMAHIASLANTQTVICLNRSSGINPDLHRSKPSNGLICRAQFDIYINPVLL